MCRKTPVVEPLDTILNPLVDRLDAHMGPPGTQWLEEGLLALKAQIEHVEREQNKADELSDYYNSRYKLLSLILDKYTQLTNILDEYRKLASEAAE